MLLAVVAAGAVSAVHIRFQLIKRRVRHQLTHMQQTPVAVSVYKHPQAVVKLPQDIVCIAADDNAALLIRNFADGPHLGVPQFLAQGAVVEVEQALGKAELVGYALVPAAHLLGCQVGAGLGGL